MKLPENLWLILHKVRGEPAWDVAEQIQLGSEQGYIIPTSGHRAYPLATSKLHSALDPEVYGHLTNLGTDGVFAAWRDHYQLTPEPRPPRPSLAKLLGTESEGTTGFTKRV